MEIDKIWTKLTAQHTLSQMAIIIFYGDTKKSTTEFGSGSCRFRNIWNPILRGVCEIGVKMIIRENDENKKNGWRFFWKYVFYPNSFWRICVVPQQITQNMCCPPTQCPSGTRTVYLWPLPYDNYINGNDWQLRLIK